MTVRGRHGRGVGEDFERLFIIIFQPNNIAELSYCFSCSPYLFLPSPLSPPGMPKSWWQQVSSNIKIRLSTMGAPNRGLRLIFTWKVWRILNFPFAARLHFAGKLISQPTEERKEERKTRHLSQKGTRRLCEYFPLMIFLLWILIIKKCF